MKRSLLIGIIVSLPLLLAACGHEQQTASSSNSSAASQLNKQVSTLTQPFALSASNSSVATTAITTPQQALQLVVNKYGTNNGQWQWGCLVSGSGDNQKYLWSNNQPVSNDDPQGYFVVRNYQRGKSANDPIHTYHVYRDGAIKLSD